MRILLYVRSWPPDYRPSGVPSRPNGVVTYTWDLVPQLRALGHEVFVLAWEKSPAWSDAYTFDLQSFATPPTLLERALWKVAPDATAHSWRSATLANAVRVMRAKHGVELLQIEETFGLSLAASHLNIMPVVVRLHGPWFLSGQFDHDLIRSGTSRRRLRREGAAIAAATAITGPSKSVLELTSGYYGHDYGLSRVIPNATRTVEPSGRWEAATADRNLLLFVGRFDRLKGGDVLLQAFARLASLDPKLRLSFVGTDLGIALPAGRRQGLREFLGGPLFDAVRQRVEYLGTLSRDEVQALRSRAFVTVVASRYETFCIAATEAMATGCPLVATAAGAIPEIVESGRNGLLVAPEDAEGMANACRALLDDPGLAARLGRQALSDCHDRYGPAQTARQTVAFFREAMDAFHAGRAR